MSCQVCRQEELMISAKDNMGEQKANDLVIQNIGAVQQTRKLSDGEEGEITNGLQNTRKLICWIYNKFRTKELEEKDFENILKGLECDENANVNWRSCRETVDEDLDKTCPVDFELDFEDGEIKVTSTYGKEVKSGKVSERERKKEGKQKIGRANNEKEINKQMKYLMTTFEQEKRNLLRKVEVEKEMVAKQVADEYEKKLKMEKEFLGTVIADLVKSVEDAKKQVEELEMIRERDRMTLQKLFKRKLADERKKMFHQVSSNSGRS